MGEGGGWFISVRHSSRQTVQSDWGLMSDDFLVLCVYYSILELFYLCRYIDITVLKIINNHVVAFI